MVDIVILEMIAVPFCSLFYIIPKMHEMMKKNAEEKFSTHRNDRTYPMENSQTTKVKENKISLIHKILLSIGILKVKKNA